MSWSCRIAGAVGAIALSTAMSAQAQTYPAHAIRWIVPFTAGGPADVIARMLVPKLSENLGQTVYIENRSGADSNIGHQAAANAAPDGYTMLYVVPNVVTNTSMFKNAVDPIKELAPVTQMVTQSYLMVAGPAFKPADMSQIIAKAKSGGVNCASGGGLPSFGCQWLRSATKGDFVEIKFQGNGPALTALMGGQVDVLIDLFNTALPQVKAGRVRPIALTRKERGNPLPDLPVIGETVPGFSLVGWHGVMVPAGTPAPIVDRLNKAFAFALADPDVKRRITANYIDVAPTTPQEFGSIIKEDQAKYARIVKDAGIEKQ